MGNKKATKRMTARRAATFLAVLGALVMSSGVALIAAAGSASAANGLSVCHPVNGNGETGNGWNLIGPDQASSHIDDSLYPDGEYWKHMNNDGRHDVYADAEGNCPGEVPPPAVCPEGTDHAGEEIPEGQTEETFCTDVVVAPTCPEGTDNAGQEIPEGQTAEVFCDDADVIVSPPTVVNPPKKHHTATVVTPTVVHAGLAGVSAQDMRGEQGLALMFAGMLMLVAAGGLGMRLRGSASRI